MTPYHKRTTAITTHRHQLNGSSPTASMLLRRRQNGIATNVTAIITGLIQRRPIEPSALLSAGAVQLECRLVESQG